MLFVDQIEERLIKENKCPICNLTLNRTFSIRTYCSHKCYNHILSEKIISSKDSLITIEFINIKIFDKEFKFNSNMREDFDKEINLLENEINYWNENDRYLVNILTNS